MTLGLAAWLTVSSAAASAQRIDRPQPAARAVPLPRTLDDETAGLATALNEMNMVAFGGVGYTGEASRGETTTRRLAARPRAAAALAWLIVHGRPAARLYAYWALRAVDPTSARRYRARLRANRTPVDFMSGCFMETSTVAEIARLADKTPFVVAPTQ